jgi:hypothetical protein
MLIQVRAWFFPPTYLRIHLLLISSISSDLRIDHLCISFPTWWQIQKANHGIKSSIKSCCHLHMSLTTSPQRMSWPRLPSIVSQIISVAHHASLLDPNELEWPLHLLCTNCCRRANVASIFCSILYTRSANVASIFCSNVCLFARAILLHVTNSMALNWWRTSYESHKWCTRIVRLFLHTSLTRFHGTRD